MGIRHGVYETEIEIPIRIHYTAYPEEQRTWTYPGCQAHIEIEDIEYDVDKEIERTKDSINERILEYLREE